MAVPLKDDAEDEPEAEGVAETEKVDRDETVEVDQETGDGSQERTEEVNHPVPPQEEGHPGASDQPSGQGTFELKFCQTLKQRENSELSLFSPCHKNKKNPTKIYQKEVNYRSGIFHLDST